jgi:GT2 family glycosyltransferase
MIYIILPVHNRLDETRKFISCLLSQIVRDYHLILIDDGCTDGTADYVGGKINNLTVLRGNGNLWWAGSLEKARKHLLRRQDVSDDDVVLIANDDITFKEDFLKKILLDLGENPSSIILAQCNEQNTGKMVDRGVVVDWKRLQFRQAENAAEINVLSTRGLYMRFEVFNRIGKFHPILLPHYTSDYEFTHRAYKRGNQLRVSDRAVVYGNLTTTGVRDIDNSLNFSALLYNLFISKNSAYNRITWTSFILLSCTPKHIPVNLFRIHIGTIIIIIRWLLQRISGRIRLM